MSYLNSQAHPSFKDNEDISNVHGRAYEQLGLANFVDTRKINFGQSNALYACPHFFGLDPNNGTFTARQEYGYTNFGQGININARFYLQ